ncbi:tubby-like F-box 8 [Olea europaea subsp. europaea]|uniref:Tubby-like F-box 8 n=1 Tax=Olea europaea subsp. europaea TaxID=158383 RepID=A0A8S0VJ37_OLEEU|nr:tubby-like F-box 8 [Olea europaea subsp. europaea]
MSRRLHPGNSHGGVHDLHDQPLVMQSSCWASPPLELLHEVIKTLECGSSQSAGKDIVVCAAVCRSWREMYKEIVQRPELFGKLAFPVSLASRSNFLRTKFIICDIRPPHNYSKNSRPGRTSCRYYSKKVSPKVPTGSYNVAQATYKLNVLGTKLVGHVGCIASCIQFLHFPLSPFVLFPGNPSSFPALLKILLRVSPLSQLTTQKSSAVPDFQKLKIHGMTRRKR